MASSPSITTGIVSSPSVSKEVREFMVVTTPIQPGNSGGPLLSQEGGVLGIVVASLNPILIARMTGTLPQNVNFALKEMAITAVLEDRGVPFDSGAGSGELGTVELAKKARGFTVQILCKR